MRKRRFGNRPSRQVLFRAFILGSAGLGLAALSVHSVFPRHEDPAHRFARLNNQLLTSPTPPASAEYAAVAKAAAEVPLSAEPFFLYGFRATADGDRARAARLIREARHRNPRHRLARLLWLDYLLLHGRTAEATVELATIRRLVPEANDIIVGQLAKLAIDPRTAPAVADTLRSGPLMNDVLERLAREGADIGQILKLAASAPRGKNDSSAAIWKEVVVSRLVENGDYQRAYALWKQFGGIQAPQGAVYNPGFADVIGSPPFNWKLANGSIGAVERPRGGGLSVDYYGRESGPIAEQLMLLGPGRYSLQFAIEGNAPGQGTMLQWRIGCANTAEGQLLELPLAGVTYKQQAVRHAFTVPLNCPAQWIRLLGVSGEFPAAQTVQLSQFSIHRADQ